MTAISISLEKDLLDQIDARAKELGIKRSVYLCKLAANDMAKGGDFIINKKGRKERGRSVLLPQSTAQR